MSNQFCPLYIYVYIYIYMEVNNCKNLTISLSLLCFFFFFLKILTVFLLLSSFNLLYFLKIRSTDIFSKKELTGAVMRSFFVYIYIYIYIVFCYFNKSHRCSSSIFVHLQVLMKVLTFTVNYNKFITYGFLCFSIFFIYIYIYIYIVLRPGVSLGIR